MNVQRAELSKRHNFPSVLKRKKKKLIKKPHWDVYVMNRRAFYGEGFEAKLAKFVQK